MHMDESVGAGGLIWKDDGIRRAATRRRFNEPSSRGNTVKMMGTDVFITSPAQTQITIPNTDHTSSRNTADEESKQDTY